mgnify:FL=1|tara:strand:+ start:369 stop:620 length:252 start_codon:yes stop_codon:yes gene_type:complete
MDYDWLDEFLEDIDANAELWQLNYIDDLLRTASLDENEKSQIEYESTHYTQKEAAITISYLKQNQVFTDPRDKWKFYNKLYKN